MMTKRETMRLLLIDVRAFLRNDSMDGVYEKGRREGLLQAIEEALRPSDEPRADACQITATPSIKEGDRVTISGMKNPRYDGEYEMFGGELRRVVNR